MADPERTAADQPPSADEALEPGRDAEGRFGAGNAYRFLPGQSGNPAGRPRGYRAVFREFLESVPKDDPERRSRLLILLQSLFTEAMPVNEQRVSLAGKVFTVRRRGNPTAARELLDRADGRVPISLKVGPDEEEGPADFRIRIVDRDDIEREAKRIPVKGLPPPGGGNGDGSA